MSRRLRTTHLGTFGGAVLLVVAAVLLGRAPTASAHDALISTSPADGATVATAPARVVLTFDLPALAMGSRVVVTAPDRSVVSSGAPTLVDTTVTEDLGGALAAGRYTVQWRVTSQDGHPVSGQFTYTATAPGRGAVPTAPRPAAPTPAPSGSPALAWTTVVALAGAVATAATVLLLRRRPSMNGPRGQS